MSETQVKEYYTAQVRNEWRRLFKDPYRHLELDTTLHFLEKYLPEGGLVLDAGGGARVDIHSSWPGAAMRWPCWI